MHKKARESGSDRSHSERRNKTIDRISAAANTTTTMSGTSSVNTNNNNNTNTNTNVTTNGAPLSAMDKLWNEMEPILLRLLAQPECSMSRAEYMIIYTKVRACCCLLFVVCLCLCSSFSSSFFFVNHITQ